MGGGEGGVSFSRLLMSFGFVVAAVLFVRKKSTARYSQIKIVLAATFRKAVI